MTGFLSTPVNMIFRKYRATSYSIKLGKGHWRSSFWWAMKFYGLSLSLFLLFWPVWSPSHSTLKARTTFYQLLRHLWGKFQGMERKMKIGVGSVPLTSALQQVSPTWMSGSTRHCSLKAGSALSGANEGAVIKLPCHNWAFLGNSAHYRWKLGQRADKEWKAHLESRWL